MNKVSVLTRHLFAILLIAFLAVGAASPCRAQIYLSTDIPADMGESPYDDRDIVSYGNSSFSSYLDGSAIGIPDGVNVVSFGFSGGNRIFSVDVPTDLDGSAYTERDIISYDGSNFSKLFDGAAAGIPAGAWIDAATVLGDGSIVLSLDVTVELGGATYEDRDLIKYSASMFSMYFDGSSNSIPNGVNLDAVCVNSSGDIFFSLDIPAEFGSLELADSDIVKWDQSTFSLYFDGDSSGIPEGANLDAFALKVVTGRAMPWLLLLLGD
jgi:hypothetical protein